VWEGGRDKVVVAESALPDQGILCSVVVHEVVVHDRDGESRVALLSQSSVDEVAVVDISGLGVLGREWLSVDGEIIRA
jgi:hypothetical protein